MFLGFFSLCSNASNVKETGEKERRRRREFERVKEKERQVKSSQIKSCRDHEGKPRRLAAMPVNVDG
jgi:hypothetical protein